MNPNLHYRPDIDGLRALAILPVVLFHAGLPGFAGGFVGVDVFFVISGYLITSIIRAELMCGDFTLARFYERRVRRLIPALFTVLLCCMPVAWLLLMPADLKRFVDSLMTASLFSANFLFLSEAGYFDTAAELKPLLHTWSLAVEEQYYIVFPALMIALWRVRPDGRAVLPALLLLAAASLVYAEWASTHQPDAAFYLLPARAWELLIGALTALYLARPNATPAQHRLAPILSSLGLLLIIAAIFGLDAATPWPGLYALLPTLGTALVILFCRRGTFSHRLLANRPMVGIGLISYGAYLWHQPLFAFMRYRATEPPSALTLVALGVLAFGLAWLTWRFIEMPARRGLSARALYRIAGACVLVFILFGGMVHGLDGVPQRYNGVTRTLVESAESSPYRDDCHTNSDQYLVGDAACRYLHPNVRWAVFGDSHAVELAYAVARALEPSGEGVAHFSISGCRPSYGQPDDDDVCARWTNDNLAYLAATPELDTVVVSYRVHATLVGDHVADYPGLPPDDDVAYIDRTWQSYVDTLALLVAAGKRVYLVLQAPELPRHINEILYTMTKHDQSAGAGVPRSWWEARTALVDQRRHEIPAEVTVIDPTDLFCDDTVCHAARDGTAFYFDDDHLSVAGAARVVDALLAAPAPERRPR